MVCLPAAEPPVLSCITTSCALSDKAQTTLGVPPTHRQEPETAKEGQLVLLGVYGSDNGLKDWTTRWEEYLETVRRDRNDVRLVYVAPEPLQEGPPRFRLLRSI